MNNVIIAVQDSNVSPEKLIGYQEIGLHMIFYIKLGEIWTGLQDRWRKGIHFG